MRKGGVDIANLTFTDQVEKLGEGLRKRHKLPVILLHESKQESFVRVISKPEAWAHCFFKPSCYIVLPASNISVSGGKLNQFLGNE